jgi:hypothetical protein
MKLTVFSQSDIDTTPSKLIPIPVLKLMIKDIISGDQAKEELKLTQSLLDSTEKKVLLKDSVIKSTYEKYEKCESVVAKEREKYTILEDYTKKLEKKLKIEQVKNKFKSFVGIGAILAIGILFIIK